MGTANKMNTKESVPSRPPFDWGAPVFVWGGWTILFLGSLAFIWGFGSNIPALEDWMLIPCVTGDVPIRSWLWESWGGDNAHRIPLPKITSILLVRWTGDFRALLAAIVLSLAALSFGMIWVVGHRRGRVNYLDALLALVPLQWGLSGDFGLFWPFATFTYLQPVLFAGVFLVIVVKYGAQLPLGAGTLAGICLVALPLSGAAGLLYLPPLVIWSFYAQVFLWRIGTPGTRRTAFVLLSLTLAAGVVAVLYNLNLNRHTLKPSGSMVAQSWTTLTTAVAFLTAGGGGAALWPYSGIITFAIFLLSTGALVVSSIRLKEPVEQSRALGLLSLIASTAMLALGIGWGRGAYGGISIGWAYNVLPMLTLCACYFAWEFSPSKIAGNFVKMCMYTWVIYGAFANIQQGYTEASARKPLADAFLEDLRTGNPPHVLIAHHREALRWGWNDDVYLAESLEKLHHARLVPYQYLGKDPTFRRMPLPLKPTAVEQITWVERVGHGSGKESALIFTLPKPMYVAGVCIRASNSNTNFWIRVSWKRADAASFPEDAQGNWDYDNDTLQVSGLTAYIADTIDAIRICPDDNPCSFQILELNLLVPENEANRSKP